jgi:CRISPR-associated protein Csd1
MILQALASYHKRLLKEGRAAQQGFQEKPIPFIIVLDKAGNFCGLTNTTSLDARKGIPRVVPRELVRPGTNAWQKANLLWDNPAYVIGYSESALADAQRKHRTFLATIKDYFPDPTVDDGVNAVVSFLKRGDFASLQKHSDWGKVKETGGNITFQLEGENRLVCERDVVVNAVVEREHARKGTKMQCLVTGEVDFPEPKHGKTKGVKGAQTSGANIVSFNLSAFNSFGKKRSLNAPVGAKAEFAYNTALNLMLANLRQRIQVGDTTTVFWAEKKHVIEDIFASIFGEPAKGEPEQDYKSLIALFRSPETGARAELDPTTKFFVLGLAPNAARIAVRFWYAGTVGEIANNIGQHFDDLEMVKGQQKWQTLSINSLLCSTAIESRDRSKKNLIYHLGKFFDVAPNLAGDTMKAILTGTPYPQTLLASVVSRIKAEQSRKDSKGKSVQNVNYTRAALIKAVLARETRLRNNKRTEKEVGMPLDTTNTNPGYLLGRLFAVLERAQEEAAKPNKINSTIRDRFYGSASSTPVTVFPHLMKLKNYHLSKMEKYKGYYEALIGEIMDKLDAAKDIPTHLGLQDQGRFAVGYYHQRQAFFKK